LVVSHGIDTTYSGLEQLWSGEDSRTWTSTNLIQPSLQGCGVSQASAERWSEVIDGGIGIVFTLGATAVTNSTRLGATIARMTGTLAMPGETALQVASRASALRAVQYASSGVKVAGVRSAIPTATRDLALRIQGNVPLGAQTVNLTATAEGPVIVTATGRGLGAAQANLARELGLTPGVALGEGFDAETNAMYTAGQLGLTPTGGVTTNAMCGHCVGQIGRMAGKGGWQLRLADGGKTYTFVKVGAP
jgi:hypothetical protein